MKKEDLLLLLQDFVEESGMFNYIRVHYTEYRDYQLDIIKRIVLKGLDANLLEVYHSFKKSSKIDDWNTRKLNLDEATTVVQNNSYWQPGEDIYEVTFQDVNKYIWILFGYETDNKPKVPDVFTEFIIE